ncbi:MAG: alpha/beta hydrolase, partial [Verrucomicrobia bacterium]
PLCPLDLLEQIRSQIKALNALYILDGGDHSLRVPKKQLQAIGETQERIDQRILEAIAKFVSSTVQPILAGC